MPVTCTSLGQSQTPVRPVQTVWAAAQMNQLAISVTTQSLESCFSPLLDTKGYHGFPELQAQGSKVPPNCSIDGRWGDSTALKSFPQWLWMLSCCYQPLLLFNISYRQVYSCLPVWDESVQFSQQHFTHLYTAVFHRVWKIVVLQRAVILQINLFKSKLWYSNNEATVWGERGLRCRVIGKVVAEIRRSWRRGHRPPPTLPSFACSVLNGVRRIRVSILCCTVPAVTLPSPQPEFSRGHTSARLQWLIMCAFSARHYSSMGLSVPPPQVRPDSPAPHCHLVKVLGFICHCKYTNLFGKQPVIPNRVVGKDAAKLENVFFFLYMHCTSYEDGHNKWT